MIENLVMYIILGIFGLIILFIIIKFIFKQMTGKIEIQLPKYNFNPGEKISGNIILKLKRPISAKSLKVGLIAQRKSNNVSVNSGEIKTSSKNNIIFQFEQPIDGEKTYSVGEKSYPFEITIPKDIGNINNIGGVAGEIAQGIQNVANMFGGRIKWYLYSEIKTTFNINKRIEINVV